MKCASRGPSRAGWIAWATCALVVAGCSEEAAKPQDKAGTLTPAAGGIAGQVGATPGPGSNAGPAAPGVDPAADLYGDQGGEKVLPADTPDAPLRAKKSEMFFRLSNPRIVTNRPGLPALAVDYEKIRDGEFGGVSLITKDAKGNSKQYMLMFPIKNADTITLDQSFPSFNGPAFPDDMELFLIHADQRYGAKQPTYKVSTSAVRGKMPRLTLARNWTAEEATLLRLPPPAYTNGNNPATSGVGHDTKFVGDSGGAQFRFVDPDHPMVGLEFNKWDFDGEKCFQQLIPVFTRDQPITFQPRSIAKEGYAVGGVNIHSKRFVNAIQLIYMKLTPDGRVDPKDSYTSDWMGDPGAGEPARLGGDGRLVIGIHRCQGAIVNALALVMDKAGP